ncbi:MAG: GDSL-type esterase/lipase family protein [Armatimonadota bacterium]
MLPPPHLGSLLAGRPAFAPAKNAQIVEVNAGIRQIAAQHGARYVDYHAALVGPDGALPHDYADDGVHPHHAGYAVMARVLKEALGDELSG